MTNHKEKNENPKQYDFWAEHQAAMIDAQKSGVDFSLQVMIFREIKNDLEKLKQEDQDIIELQFHKIESGLMRPNYPYDDFLVSWTLIIERLPSSAQKKVSNKKIEKSDFEKMKEATLKREKEKKEAQVSFEKANPNYLKLDLEQRSFLNAFPGLHIATVVAQARKKAQKDGVEGIPVKELEFFKGFYVDAVYKEVEKWASKQRSKIQSITKANLAAKESAIRQKMGLDKKSVAGKGVGALGNGLMGLGGHELAGLFGGQETSLISANPSLSKLFGNEKAIAALYGLMDPNKAPKDSEAAIKKLIGAQFDSFFIDDSNPKPITLDNIAASFTKFGTDEELKKKPTDIDFLILKMKTIEKGYKNTEWAEKYDDYVRSTGKGSMDFPEWIKTQDVPFFEKMFAWLKNMLPGFVVDMFSKKDTENTSKQVEKYKELREEVDPDYKTDDPNNPEFPLKDDEVYKDIRDRFQKKYPGKPPSFLIDGKPLNQIKKLTDDQKTQLQALNNLTKDYPETLIFLQPGKNFKLEDLVYLNKHKEDTYDGDGINVIFDKKGISFDAEFGSYLSHFTEGLWDDDTFNAEVAGGSALIAGGITAVALPAGMATSAVIAIPALIAAAVGGTVYAVSGIDSVTLASGNYEDLTGDDLTRMIQKAKDAEKEIKSSIEKEVEKLKKLTSEERSTLLESSGFLEVSQDLPAFWHGYKITSEDVLLFNHFEGSDGDFGFDESSLDVFHREKIDKGDSYIKKDGTTEEAKKDMEVFEVNGTGSWWGNQLFGNGDLRFENMESFFAWLRKSPKAQSVKQDLTNRPS